VLEKIFLGPADVSEDLAPPPLSDQHEKDIGQNQLRHTGGQGSLKVFHCTGARHKAGYRRPDPEASRWNW
jgi:hypothetical protein